ncbi:MAG TPA: L-alanine exporter AlaE [Candidatus Nanoarchaeia archaeon]|nr:L-alanine exporter AlaE [Candidatus Nanoarchaeia archaeon]
MSIEELVNPLDEIPEKHYRFESNSLYGWLVNTGSGIIYYTLTYGTQELATGGDLNKVVKTRLIGGVVHSIVRGPVGLLRDYVAKKRNVTKESPLIDKIKVNLIAITPMQSVVYAGMLIGGMALSGDWDWVSSGVAYAIGIGTGAAHAVIYGNLEDKSREFFGIRPAISEKSSTVQYK